MEVVISIVLVLVIIAAVLFLVFKPKEKGENQGRDAYFYLVSFISLALLYWALSDLVRVWLSEAWGVGNRSYYSYYGGGNTYQQDTLRNISLRLSTIMVALPVYIFHWYKAIMKKREEWDVQSRKSYCLGVLVLTSLMILGGGTGMVYQATNSMLGVSSSAAESLAWLIPYTLSAAGLWVVHFKFWREVSEIKKEVVLEKPEALEVK
jgi:hypothetical protein